MLPDTVPVSVPERALSEHTEGLVLAEAELIRGLDAGNREFEKVVPFRLTWEGFLEAARDEGRWNEALEKAGDLSFDVVKAPAFPASQAPTAALDRIGRRVAGETMRFRPALSFEH